MKKVLVFGTFDLLHPGHLDFFRQAREYGDHLTAVIARDQTVLKVKDHLPRQSEEARLQAVRSCGLVDEARLGSLTDKYEAIKSIFPDVICLGYDQTYLVDDLAAKLRDLGSLSKIVRLKPFQPEKYKSSKMQ